MSDQQPKCPKCGRESRTEPSDGTFYCIPCNRIFTPHPAAHPPAQPTDAQPITKGGDVPCENHSGNRLETTLQGNPAAPASNPPEQAEQHAAGELLPCPSLDLIKTERRRQVLQEGWTPEHDDEHEDGALASAAAAYALTVDSHNANPEAFWPWDDGTWKPSDDPIRNLVKAGALICAEIDRLLRNTRTPQPVPQPVQPSEPASEGAKYRELEPGELVQAGDEIYLDSKDEWGPVRRDICARACPSNRYRRQVKPTPASESAVTLAPEARYPGSSHHWPHTPRESAREEINTDTPEAIVAADQVAAAILKRHGSGGEHARAMVLSAISKVGAPLRAALSEQSLEVAEARSLYQSTAKELREILDREERRCKAHEAERDQLRADLAAIRDKDHELNTADELIKAEREIERLETTLAAEQAKRVEMENAAFHMHDGELVETLRKDLAAERAKREAAEKKRAETRTAVLAAAIVGDDLRQKLAALEAELENCRVMGMARYESEMQPGFHWVNERAEKAEDQLAAVTRELDESKNFIREMKPVGVEAMAKLRAQLATLTAELAEEKRQHGASIDDANELADKLQAENAGLKSALSEERAQFRKFRSAYLDSAKTPGFGPGSLRKASDEALVYFNAHPDADSPAPATGEEGK